MKPSYLLSLALFFFVASTSFAEWNRGTLKGTSGRVIRYEQYVTKTKSPVLLFLPGIYRGQMSTDAFTQDLVRAHIPFVFMHFAEQPDSVVETAHGVVLDFSQVSRSTLAQEVKAVAAQLGLQKVIPVTLSYSAVVTEKLDADVFPAMIEVSPIAKQLDDQPPQVIQFYEFWEAWAKAMPFGEAWLLNAKRVQLHQHWSDWLSNYKERLPKLQDPEYFEKAVQGYTSLTLAADEFDLREQNFKKGPARYFILGKNEETYRSQIQQEAIALYQEQTGHKDNVWVVEEAGHNVPADQPAEYVSTLKEIIKGLK